MIEKSKSGHTTTCASIAELMAVLFFSEHGMNYNPKLPAECFASDRFVLSKGHAAPILYAVWAENGFLQPDELLDLRTLNSRIEGHPSPVLPFVDAATGSLGQGLGVACGMAYASKYLDKIPNRFWVIVGDGESAEGKQFVTARQFLGIPRIRPPIQPQQRNRHFGRQQTRPKPADATPT